MYLYGKYTVLLERFSKIVKYRASVAANKRITISEGRGEPYIPLFICDAAGNLFQIAIGKLPGAA